MHLVFMHLQNNAGSACIHLIIIRHSYESLSTHVLVIIPNKKFVSSTLRGWLFHLYLKCLCVVAKFWAPIDNSWRVLGVSLSNGKDLGAWRQKPLQLTRHGLVAPCVTASFALPPANLLTSDDSDPVDWPKPKLCVRH